MAKYGINKAILVGNLGRDPELRRIGDDVAVCNFSLATTQRVRSREGNYEDRTEWHNIVMWRGLAETAAKYLKKGSTVYLEGKITTRNYDDADGKTIYRTEIVADEMVMLDSRGDQRLENLPGSQNTTKSGSTVSEMTTDYSNSTEPEDDLPF